MGFNSGFKGLIWSNYGVLQVRDGTRHYRD